jgi:hypothetical protein
MCFAKTTLNHKITLQMMDLYLQMAEAHLRTHTAAATAFCYPAAITGRVASSLSVKACGVRATLVVGAGKRAPLYVVATRRRVVHLLQVKLLSLASIAGPAAATRRRVVVDQPGDGGGGGPA